MKRILLLLLATLFTSTLALAKININTATENELELLDGIGPNRAKAIVNYRQQHGSFKSTEDIKRVPGIKDSIYGKVKDDIATDGPTVAPEKKQTFIDKTQEKTASVVKKSADSVERTAHSLKARAAQREQEARP